jgi:hypothetical protein
MCKIYTPNFRNGATKATVEDFYNLAEESEIIYEKATEVR